LSGQQPNFVSSHELHSGPAPLPLPDSSIPLDSHWKHPWLSGPVACVI
jgi:hypothetical protein